jgi:hypothetical protein
MFKELSPLLRQRAVLLTVTRLEEDEIRVNIIPIRIGEIFAETESPQELLSKMIEAGDLLIDNALGLSDQ